ncbi:hypothetical protein [Agromyces marinus]|nr:hypothetical protein [Agromyces marinus]
MDDSARTGPDRTLLVILGVLVALVVIALIVVFARGGPDPRDPASPEGVVQRYAQAVIDGDEDAAMDLLTPDAVDACVRVPQTMADRTRVTLAETVERDDTADVDVIIATSYGDEPFGGSEYEEQGTFELERVDGLWLIGTAPWPLAVCDPVAAGR